MDDSFSINCTVIEKDKNRLNLIRKIDGLKDFESLAGLLPKHIPIQLCVIGKSIISREYKHTDNINIAEIIHEIMPGIDINQVYYSYIKDDEAQYNEINIARKELINNILETAKKAGLFVTETFVGLAPLHNLKNITDLSSVTARNCSIKYDRFFEISYSATEAESRHIIGDDELGGSFILPYGTSLHWFVRKEHLGNLEPLNSFNKAEFIAHKRFLGTAVLGLAFVFVALLINMFVFSGQTNKFNEYNGFLRLNQKNLTKLESLKQEVKLKEKHLLENDLLSGTRFSYYSDKIGQLTPSSISLNRLNVFPLVNSRNKSTEFSKDLILISGNGKSGPLQDFIDRLKKEEWTSDVDLKEFAQVSKSADISFTLYVYTR